MARPEPSEYAPYHNNYVALVPEEDVKAALESQLGETLAVLSGIAEKDATVCHPPYTWTIKQVVGHLVDTERIFGYRALRFARGDCTPLPGFDEHIYAQTANSDRRSLADLAAELGAVRKSHLLLFQSLPSSVWHLRGIANDNEVSVRALAYIIVGHERHHTNIVRDRLSRLPA